MRMPRELPMRVSSAFMEYFPYNYIVITGRKVVKFQLQRPSAGRGRFAIGPSSQAETASGSLKPDCRSPALPRRPSQRPSPKQMHVEMKYGLPRAGTDVEHGAVSVFDVAL